MSKKKTGAKKDTDLLAKIGKLNKELKDCVILKKEYLESWQKERANFLNYKKEEAERQKKHSEIVLSFFLLRFLPVLDNLDLAEKKIKHKLKSDADVQGLLQIGGQIRALMKDQGLEEINPEGEMFDVNSHEALVQVKKEKKESGVILSVIQKGYKLHGKLIRPAKVKVAK